MTLSQTIKAAFKKHGVKCSTSKYGRTITVTLLSPCSQAQVEEVRALQTVEHHGDMMNDTAWSTGISIQFRIGWAPTAKETTQAFELYHSWSDASRADRVSFERHFRAQLVRELGLIGNLLADRWIYKNFDLAVA